MSQIDPQELIFIDRVLADDQRNLQLLAAEGTVPLSSEGLVELQVRLARLPDKEIAARARQSLLARPVAELRDLLRAEASLEVLAFFAEASRNPGVVEAVLQRRDVPVEVLLRVAPVLGVDMQEILLLRQDLIIENPRVLDALESNAKLSTYCKRVVAEYRQHLLRTTESGLAPIDLPAPPPPTEEEQEEKELYVAIEKAREEVAPEGDVDEEQTGLSEAQIRALPVPLRVRLARGASRTLRNLLIRDPNPNVAVTVMKESGITEAEIEQVSSNRFVADEVLTEISRRREWVGKYQVGLNLCKNPRTQVAIAVRLLPRLSVRDLGQLRVDRNVSEGVRQTANRLWKAKAR